MQHPADHVNAFYQQRSVAPWSGLGIMGVPAPCVTWDVIVRLHQAGR
jgi:hypothetical protein